MERDTVEKQTSRIPRFSRPPVSHVRAIGSSIARPKIDSEKSAGLSIPKQRKPPRNENTYTSGPPARSLAATSLTLSHTGATAPTPKTDNSLDVPLQHLPAPLDTGISLSKPLTETLPEDVGNLNETSSHGFNVPDKPKSNASSKPKAIRRSRLSLSERTVETISQIPPSPSPGRRQSSFHTQQSPSPLPNTLGDGSRFSRETKPYSSLALRSGLPSTDSRIKGASVKNGYSLSSIYKPPGVDSYPHSTEVGVTQLRPATKAGETRPRRQGMISAPSESPGNTASIKPSTARNSQYGSKSLVTRKLQTRPPVSPGRQKSPQTSSTQQRTMQHPGSGKKASNSGRANHMETKTQTATSHSPGSCKATPDTSALDVTKGPKTSLALRQNIAKMKAARKLATKADLPQEMQISITQWATETSESTKGMTLNKLDDDGMLQAAKSLIPRRVESARTDGRLDISGMGLREVPKEVLNMYNFETIEAHNGSWSESVDLVHFAAASNELEVIDSSIFPDFGTANGAEELDENDSQFGSLKTLDLHGNLLRTVPIGLRCLEQLSTLDLSHNKLTTACLDVISQCATIRNLKLAHNEIDGELGQQITRLADLEALDVSGNSVTSLSENLARLSHLRLLNLSGNAITSLPVRFLVDTSVTKLLASNNRISGVLLPTAVKSLDSLQTLDLSSNALTLLTELPTLGFPALRQLNLAGNRIAALPGVAGWHELLTLNVSENQLSSLPNGFTSLSKIKQVNFTANNLRDLDAKVSLMETLENLAIARNPLRVTRYLSMPTEDLKSTLKHNLESVVEESQVPDEEAFLSDDQAEGDGVALEIQAQQETWPVRSGGVIDRSSTGLSDLDMSIFQATAAGHDIVSVDLHQNLFTTIPLGLSLLAPSLASLSIANNKLNGQDYLPAGLDLPRLRTLNISFNSITTLEPLLNHLSAPLLSTLNISVNRIATLPVLRDSFPKLAVLNACDNCITELVVESIDGLKDINLANNDIAHLPPKLGLLESIESLEVGGNKFRVPKWTVLEKGTKATMEWLRDKIPLDERAEGAFEE